ncbi:MAG: crcB 2 [Marmoricola sp.]|nr:crcB 2 [Marmoricola sp.]
MVALGAAVGAPARLLVGRALDSRTPWGTLLVNLAGSALLGWLVGHGTEGRPLALLGTGFCGALTTYSAVAVQSTQRSGRHGTAYAIGTVLGCLVVAWVGYLAGA